ncbi:MAG: hypothetical protein WD605_01330 [Candidatus Paceibacterota bacterium]
MIKSRINPNIQGRRVFSIIKPIIPQKEKAERPSKDRSAKELVVLSPAATRRVPVSGSTFVVEVSSIFQLTFNRLEVEAEPSSFWTVRFQEYLKDPASTGI